MSNCLFEAAFEKVSFLFFIQKKLEMSNWPTSQCCQHKNNSYEGVEQTKRIVTKKQESFGFKIQFKVSDDFGPNFSKLCAFFLSLT